MKNLISPPRTIPYLQLYKNIISAKKDTIKGNPNAEKIALKSLETKVTARYSLFEQAINNNNLFGFVEDTSLLVHKEILIGCYEGRTKKVKEVFTLIEKSQSAGFLRVCPYCGITLPKTYDHYLPKTLFPELSVHALNLIPCCGTCNGIKGDVWKNKTHIAFLHLYSAIIPNEEFLSVELFTKPSANSIGARFQLHKPEDMDNDIWNVLSYHYENLKLLERYNELANDEVTRIFTSCVCHLNDGGNSIAGFLVPLGKSEESLYGLNYWLAVLIKALSSNVIFETLVANAVNKNP